MAVDVICLSETQQRHLNQLIKACRFLVEVKGLGVAQSGIDYAIDQVAVALQKIDKS